MHNPSLPDVKFVNVNHRDSWQGALTHHFRKSFKSHSFKNVILSILTLGVYPYKKYKKAKRAIAQALAARKLFFFRALQEHIEAARKDHVHVLRPVVPLYSDVHQLPILFQILLHLNHTIFSTRKLLVLG